jgi:hypothetical protein
MRLLGRDGRHKSASGDVLETGVRVASELLLFESYGVVPGALMRGGRAFFGSTPAGRLAVFRIRLLPMWGLPKTATLQVNCAFGKVPPEHPTEGIRLTFDGGGGAEFNEEVSARTMFVSARPGASAAPKAPTPGSETSPAPAEVQQWSTEHDRVQ